MIKWMYDISAFMGAILQRGRTYIYTMIMNETEPFTYKAGSVMRIMIRFEEPDFA